MVAPVDSAAAQAAAPRDLFANMNVGANIWRAQSIRSSQNEIVSWRNIVRVTRERHPRRLAALKAHFISPVQQLKNCLQVVIPVRALAGHMEKKI